MNMFAKIAISGGLMFCVATPVVLMLTQKDDSVAFVESNLNPLDDDVSTWRDPISGCLYLFPNESHVLTIHRHPDGTMDCPDVLPAIGN